MRKSNLLEVRGAAVPDFVTDGLILALWRENLDTFDIAKKLQVRECEVANKLWRLRSAGK